MGPVYIYSCVVLAPVILLDQLGTHNGFTKFASGAQRVSLAVSNLLASCYAFFFHYYWRRIESSSVFYCVSLVKC